MAVRDDLTERIRRLVVMDPRVTEKRMFGGICFLLDGRILVSARRTGTLLVQCGAAAAATAVLEPGVTRMVMGGKPAANFIDVDNDDLDSDEGLARWIEMAERYVTALPPGKD
jgi:hypothetical protein